MNTSKSFPINRRQFLRNASAGVAIFQLAPSGLLSGAQGASSSEKLNLAGIGIGSRGGSDIKDMAEEGQNLVALCDVDGSYAGKEFDTYHKAKQFKDFRVMDDKMDKE